VAHTGADVSSAELASLVESVPGLAAPVSALCDGSDDSAEIAAAVEFILEGLHLSRRLNKDASGSAATYRAR
jgi:magnesium chelatase subunit I